MRKTIKLCGLALALFTGACAVPIADQPRFVDYYWSLEPETAETQRETVQQGDIIFTWSAQAHATHYVPSLDLDLTRTTPRSGNLFCGQRGEDHVCYEDRDENGMLDRSWRTYVRSHEPTITVRAGSPQVLDTEIPFEVLEKSEESPREVLVEQTLGLVYAGPVRGSLNDNLEFEAALGEFTLGWIESEDTMRGPNGIGWSELRTIPLIYLREAVTIPTTTVNPLRLTYAVYDMTMAGGLEVELTAQSIREIQLRTRFTFDVEGADVPEELSLTSGTPAPASETDTAIAS